MSFRLRIAILVSIVASALPCGAAVRDFLPDPQVPPRLVNDFASAFPAACADSLEAVLVDFDNRTSNQICVVTVTDLHDYDVARYALFLANKWGVGSKKNNGVLILLKTRMGGYVDVTMLIPLFFRPLYVGPRYGQHAMPSHITLYFSSSPGFHGPRPAAAFSSSSSFHLLKSSYPAWVPLLVTIPAM